MSEMMVRRAVGHICAALIAMTGWLSAQSASDPFPLPLSPSEETITVGITEFASLPDVDGRAARMMLIVDEPDTGRLFVNDMHGRLYSVGYDGQSVTLYLNLTAERWGLAVEASGQERGFQSFAFHPQFGEPETAGFGKLYTYFDTSDTAPTQNFAPGAAGNLHDTVLLEWTANNPHAPVYDGDRPREVMRFEQPFSNHNGGQIGFNPYAEPEDADRGLLYVGVGDGGSGGDPLNLAQDLNSVFGKILRINPLLPEGGTRQYGIPEDNPFAGDTLLAVREEVYVYGLRNPQRFGWDACNGNMFVADIGQNTVEEISSVTPGADLGWNLWEGSFRFIGPQVSLVDPRSDPEVVYPFVEYDRRDSLLGGGVAVTGVIVQRETTIPELADLLLFGDFPSGEIFAVKADGPRMGGQAGVRRVLLDHDGTTNTLLGLIQEKNIQQGKFPAWRADLRFGTGAEGQLFLLNKHDGTIRRIVTLAPVMELTQGSQLRCEDEIPAEPGVIVMSRGDR